MRAQGLVPVVITSSASISACAKGQQAVRALVLFQAMRDLGSVPGVSTSGALISACAKEQRAAQRAARALELIQARVTKNWC